VAIAPDGSWLVTAGADKKARIWAADGTARATLTGHAGRVTGVAIAPDGTWLATTSWDSTARVWAIARRAAARSSASSPSVEEMNTRTR
jgi:WD40 repeat protein